MSSGAWPVDLTGPTTRTTAEHQFFAPCPKGLQDYLAAEIEQCGATQITPGAAGVAFSGTLAQAYRLNRTSRIASRVLWQLISRRYRVDKDLYRIAMRIAWHDHIAPSQTIRVDIRATRSHLRSIRMAALRVKDAVVDTIRENTGLRPGVDTASPDVRISVYLEDQQASLYLDLSGDSLFMRGWRGSDNKGNAPLKENLAAGLLLASGWDASKPLYDPFCGSGTLVIEAAQMALGIAPRQRSEYGLQRLRSFDARAWLQACDASQDYPGVQRMAQPIIYASDIDPEMVRIARDNAHRALGHVPPISSREKVSETTVRFTTGDFVRLPPPDTRPGWLVANPPYGERMTIGGKGDPLSAMGHHLRAHYAGWTVCFLTSDLKLPGKLGLKPRRRIPLYNGTLDCRFFIFDMR